MDSVITCVSCENETLYSIKACWTWHKFLHINLEPRGFPHFPFSMSKSEDLNQIYISITG